MDTNINPQTASPLAGIPTELLTRITGHLTTEDLCKVRLTCKLVASRMHSSFAYEFFRKKQFMISTVSLQALVDIADNPLGAGLNHVIMATDV